MLYLRRVWGGFAIVLALAGAARAEPQPLTDDLLGSVQAAYSRAVTPGDSAERHRELLGTVLRRVQRSYVTEADFSLIANAAYKVLQPLEAGSAEPAETFRKAVTAGLRAMDNYARYLTPKAYEQDQNDNTGHFVGLGIEVESADGVVRVVRPMEGGPAERAGMRSGDLIVRVDGTSLHGMPLSDAISRMRGEAGTRVTILVRREGANEFELSLARDTIRTQRVRWRMEGDALVLRLSSFNGPVSQELTDAINQATSAQAPRAVVLDLRGNPGGLLREAVRVADAFLAQGEITSLRGRTPSNQRSWQADAAQVLAGVPMVVLVDKNSASAAELVAAALQENGRATVMGQRSFGKGSVQTTFELGEGLGAVKFTTALYYGPAGRTVNKAGVSPDVELVAAAADASRADQAPMVAPLSPAARVEPQRCALTAGLADTGLSCALALLQAGSVDAFIAAAAYPVP